MLNSKAIVKIFTTFCFQCPRTAEICLVSGFKIHAPTVSVMNIELNGVKKISDVVRAGGVIVTVYRKRRKLNDF